MSDNTEYLTKEKFDELTKELDKLKTVRRKEVAESLEYAKSLGDLSENAEYQEAREIQANIEDRIVKLETLLQSAVIMEQRHTDAVDIGSKVTLQKENNAEQIVYNIVGSEESDLSKKKLSINSPLGHALLNKRQGETCVAKTPGGEIKYKIVDIE